MCFLHGIWDAQLMSGPSTKQTKPGLKIDEQTLTLISQDSSFYHLIYHIKRIPVYRMQLFPNDCSSLITVKDHLNS